MRMTVVSHAGLLVETGGKQLLCDPWFVGSCYWRSWWNYPPVKQDLVDRLKPDWIYITHIHWDHFHGASLRRFPPDTPIFVPYDRYTRIRDDLAKSGFTDVRELFHGRRQELTGELALTSYQFSPLTDSALVVECEGQTILDANDAKFMGGPLNHILRNHPKVDVALRSHSSANSRLCYEYYEAPDEEGDDVEGYLRAFWAFMYRVKPRFAVPFASSHCHLHRDAIKYNDHIQTPSIVADYMTRFKEEHPFDTQVAVMTSGDSWDSNTGFDITPSPYLLDREAGLARYAEEKRASLERTYAREARSHVGEKLARTALVAFANAVPAVARRRFRGRPIHFEVVAGEDRTFYRFDLHARSVELVPAASVAPTAMRVVAPAAVLKQALAMNMFGHAAISKRLRFRATRADMPLLRSMEELLSLYEFECLPLKKLFSARTIASYGARWREVVLYVRLALGLLRGVALRQQEEQLLGGYVIKRS